MKTVAVIGAGAAGYYASVRLAAATGWRVALFDAVSDGLFAKIRLPEYVSGSLAREKLILADAAKMRAAGIDPRLGDPVRALLPASQELVLASGEHFAWDRLILATGASAALPPVPGLDSTPNVLTLRRLADADRLIELGRPGGQALILGGGLLGLEAAWSLKQRGMKVVILECMNCLLPRQLTERASAALLTACGQQGFEVRLNARAAAVSAPEPGRVRVTCADGSRADGDLLLVSAGIRPEIGLASDAGLACGRAVKVNERMETSEPNIYAAGDCAEQNGMDPGLWIAAKAQGEAVADVITGKRTEFVYPEYRPSLKISGLDINSLISKG